MRVIMTNDGLIGLDFNPNSNVVWCDSVEQAIPIAKASYNHLGVHAPTATQMDREIRDAVDQMAKLKHSVAHFGVMGTFMFTVKEEEE